MDVSLFKDLVDLARNGYKPSDVKELLTMMKDEKQEPEKKEPDEKKEPEKKEPEKKEPDKKELIDAFAKLVEDNK